jgi:cell division protein ZapA
MPKQPVRVQIYNQTYSLLTESDPREVAEIAQQIDDLMTTIAHRTGSADTTRIAVLACLHMADRLRATEKQLRKFENRSEEIAALLEETLELG